jgi:hypothetical protein
MIALFSPFVDTAPMGVRAAKRQNVAEAVWLSRGRNPYPQTYATHFILPS